MPFLPRWKYMTPAAKLRTKRFILLPLIAYAVLSLIRAYMAIIIIGLIFWFLYNWYEQRR